MDVPCSSQPASILIKLPAFSFCTCPASALAAGRVTSCWQGSNARMRCLKRMPCCWSPCRCGCSGWCTHLPLMPQSACRPRPPPPASCNGALHQKIVQNQESEASGQGAWVLLLKETRHYAPGNPPKVEAIWNSNTPGCVRCMASRKPEAAIAAALRISSSSAGDLRHLPWERHS